MVSVPDCQQTFHSCGDISFIIDDSISLSDEEALKKIELINILHHKIAHCNADGVTCYWVIVPIDNETLDVLHKLGLTNKDIMERARWDAINKKSVIELIEIGCQFSRWWDEKTGFSLYKPIND